jgi:hypothetical protein
MIGQTKIGAVVENEAPYGGVTAKQKKGLR